MRIAHFHNTPSGGAKRAIYEWTQRLAINHQVDVYTLSTADHNFCDIRSFVHNHSIFDFKPKRLFNSPFGRLNQLQRWRDLGELTQVGQAIAREMNAGNYDVIFANTCRYTFIPTFLRWVKAPTVYYLHEPFGYTFVRHFERPYWRDNRWRARINRFDPLIALYAVRLETLQRTSVRHTKRLLANSRFTQAQMKAGFGVDAPVCHYGVNSEQFQPLSTLAKENFVISVGELSPRKGFDFLVKSMGHIPAEKRPTLKLACNMVQSAEKAYVEALANQSGVDLQILTGLTAQELTVYFNKAQMCVYAPVLEPFGLVPLEAMACGTPVVGVGEGGVSESVIHEHTGLLVTRDPLHFAEAMQILLSDPNRALHYGNNGRAHVLRNWTWEHATATLEEHLQLCAEGQKGSVQSRNIDQRVAVNLT